MAIAISRNSLELRKISTSAGAVDKMFHPDRHAKALGRSRCVSGVAHRWKSQARLHETKPVSKETGWNL